MRHSLLFGLLASATGLLPSWNQRCADDQSWGFHFATLARTTAGTIAAASFANIGVQSDKCFLPTTPADQTFSIWAYLYAHTALNLGPLACDLDFLRGTEASGRWVTAWSSNSLVEAADALQDTVEALVSSATRECSNDPGLPWREDTSTCCFLMQYAAWAKSALLQNKQILKVYGSSCVDGGGWITSETANKLRLEYVTNMTQFVKFDLESNLYAMKTFSHAAAGICSSCQTSAGPATPIEYPGSDCTAVCDAADDEPVKSYGFQFDACSIDPNQEDWLKALLATLHDKYPIEEAKVAP